ncbi:uncharacterized protein LOC116769567 [Danaus plexippus]|uniref:uncharacterized protein LOC116769567 n=1 Tax=Danaus plexippus TaxID=13037 RepID=UPI0013C41859|nr:uncharacterized protein LOC116769567 [Danaus plexippus]XP_032528563.1 uncharacterized protein LOC116778622 [Danaus plexippus plexippus]
MFGLIVLVALVGGGFCDDNQGPRPFVQSQKDLTYVRLMLQNLVPPDNNNLTVPSARVHLSGGVLAAVTLAVGKSLEPFGSPYDPLSVLEEIAPVVWENYNGVAVTPLNKKLAELIGKVQPVIAVIEVLCPGTDVETCNALVEQTLKNNRLLNNRGDLLLSAGRVAGHLRKNEKSVLATVKEYLDLPNLIRAMETQEYKELAYDLADLDRRLDHVIQ